MEEILLLLRNGHGFAGTICLGRRWPWKALSCEHCGIVSPRIISRPCMTAYHEDSLNVRPVLCDQCFEAYQDYWLEMWAEYRSNLL